MDTIVVNSANEWRLQSPGVEGWPRTARPNDPNKYFMVSCDDHANEPASLWAERMDAQYKDRLPKIWIDENGVQWRKSEGQQKPDRLALASLEGEDATRSKAGADINQRLRDLDRDGLDAELVFPNKGLAMWSTPDPVFAGAQCKVYNDWAWETYGAHIDRCSPAATISPGDLEGSIAEVQRVAALGFKCVNIPCKPIYGPHDANHVNYNLPHFDPLWAAIQETGMPITLHISTGKDPRTSRGPGGALMNYFAHAFSPIFEPVSALCASGVLDRFPGLHFSLIETGVGWIPWMIDAMDEVYKKHHFWVRPKLQHGLPSDYFRKHFSATFSEDRSGLELCEQYNLQDNFLWASDYPHHEGTWPHSAEAIERDMGGIEDSTRAKILGLNAAKIFNFPIPARFQKDEPTRPLSQ
ncbi:MAG: amidohydrolase family protein [Janthinobacterium lividum]